MSLLCCPMYFQRLQTLWPKTRPWWQHKRLQMPEDFSSCIRQEHMKGQAFLCQSACKEDLCPDRRGICKTHASMQSPSSLHAGSIAVFLRAEGLFTSMLLWYVLAGISTSLGHGWVYPCPAGQAGKVVTLVHRANKHISSGCIQLQLGWRALKLIVTIDKHVYILPTMCTCGCTPLLARIRAKEPVMRVYSALRCRPFD